MAGQDFDERALRRAALATRRQFLKMHFAVQAGHLGTGLSSIELLTYLYRQHLSPKDRFILSKGHGASALYATLHQAGHFSDELIATYYQDGTTLPAHPAARAHEEITAATGSLGHGAPIAAGLAYAHKHLHQDDTRVVALLSDGECNEGSTWEAVMFAAHHDLSNLTFIVDKNGLQGFGHTRDVLNPDLGAPFAEKWRAFGWDTVEIDGHDFAAIHRALTAPRDARPRCVVARTVKGKGVKFMEDRMEWHYLPLREPQYSEALAMLDAAERELGTPGGGSRPAGGLK
jgi:transketolase